MFDELIFNITNFNLLKETFTSYIVNFNFNAGFMLLMMIFMIVGGIDLLLGNKKGYGEKFQDGFNAMGALAIPLIGMVAIAPVLKVILEPILSEIFNLIGANKAMFPTLFLASDLGGYALAAELANGSVSIQNYSGLLQGAMMGCTICFTIPVGLSMISKYKNKQSAFSLGILLGLITIPVGMFVGGLVMNVTGNPISIYEILINMVPLIFIAILIGIGLIFYIKPVTNGFKKFGVIIEKITIISVMLAIFQYQTGIQFPLFSKMIELNANGNVPIEEGLNTLTAIGIVLIGAFPLVEFISRHAKGIFEKVGHVLGMSEIGITGLLASCANLVPTFNILDQMENKSIFVIAAFSVPASCIFGDFIGIAAGFDATMITAMIVGKGVAGILAIILTHLTSGKLLKDIEEDEYCERV